jgi:pseudo-rSAM protein/SPASM domain protein
MISVSKLLTDLDTESDGLRYDAADESDSEQITEDRQQRPVVVWNVTRGCNLSCEHCYASAEAGRAEGELTTEEGKALLDDLADYGVPVVLFSGGEPLVRDDLEELVAYADDLGLRPVLSSNGTLVTEERAQALKDAGLKYAGISIDGLPETNDEIRGQDGAFDAALEGIETFQKVDLKTGLRFTITEHNVADLEELIDLLELVDVDRFCFYHLSYGGRGTEIQDIDLSAEKRREVVQRVCDLTLDAHERGHDIETLLVGNYADTGLIVEYARERLGEAEADTIRAYLRENGGDPTGERIADVDYQGNVHLNQFWQDYSLGNVRDRPFSAIWEDESNDLLYKLRHREEYLNDKCVNCNYFDICRGASRLRALTVHDDPFAPDPQCHLTDEEIGIDTSGALDSTAD